MRRIVVQLPTDEFKTLVRLADRDERAVDRQATWLLRQALTPQAAPTPPADRTQPAGAGVGPATATSLVA